MRVYHVMESEGPAIGIDLGTTFSCVAVVRNNKVDIIPNEQGNYTTPSFVAFTEHERLIGDAAKDQMMMTAASTIFDVKRLIGRQFNDPILQKDMKYWPFKIVDVKGMPKIEVLHKNVVKRFAAEEISAMVLGRLKDCAESFLNAKVTNAVITVPAYFNDLQRKATKNAGTIAGLNVSRIINEPTAAALAYGVSNGSEAAGNVLVYDLGGGTFDVSILNICGSKYVVKATGGDAHLGGEDFDNILVAKFAADFKRKHKVDISENKRALRRLRMACERAKRTLSSAQHASIQIDSLCDGIDFVTDLTRAWFNELCTKLFGRTIKVVKDTLKDADLECDDIDTVVLVGGSTRIVRIQELLQDLFEGKEIHKSVDADQVVAQGAAILAAITHDNVKKELRSIKLLDVTPLSLGIGTYYGFDEMASMCPIIKRNTPIPVSASDFFVTYYDDQTAVDLPVLQGESKLEKDNFKIGLLTVDGIPAAPHGVESITVKFSIDANGILSVSAVSDSNRKACDKLTIKNVCGSLTQVEIDRMVADAEMYRAQDNEANSYRTARWELEEYCRELKISHVNNKNVCQKCNEVLNWLESCSRPSIIKFKQRQKELKALISVPKKRKSKSGRAIKAKAELDDNGNEMDEGIDD